MFDYALLKKLCLCSGISGDEGEVRDIILGEIKGFADEIKIDNLGNILAKKKGKNPSAARLMLSAHMDEVGLMITEITGEGFLKFDEVGGIDRRVLLGEHVLIGKNRINGIIGIKPIHLTKGDEKSSVPSYSEMYIDIRAESREQALEYVCPGDSVCFVPNFRENGFTITSKAIDDRFGCCVLIEMIKSELEYDMDFVFAVQEEVGLRGAKVAAYTVDPEFALVVETTTAADIPEIGSAKQVCRLGDGAVISFMDRRTIYDKEMVDLSFEAAKLCGTKAQYKRAVAGGNDSGAIQQSRGGVRTLAISLACRYLHSPSCVADKNDCESVMELVKYVSAQIAGGNLINRG